MRGRVCGGVLLVGFESLGFECCGFPTLGRSLLFSIGAPLPPVAAQNLENKRFILRLCARSLSLKELHAKSREHGSYGRGSIPIWESAGILGAGFRSHALAGIRLSKIAHYL